MIKVIAPFILSILIPYFAHAQSCKSILGASISRETILMEIASLSQDVEQAKLSGDTTAFISLESSLNEKVTKILRLNIINEEDLKIFLNNQSEELIKKAKEEIKDKKEKREIQNELLKIENFINRLRSENNIVSWFNDFKNFNEADQKTIVRKLSILKNQDNIIAKKIEEISLIWNTDLEIYKEVLKSELIKTINLNARNYLERTPLHEAAARQEKELAELLIRNGADVNAKNGLADTPLHLTSNREIAKLLIQNGADVNAKNDFEDTPLHEAATRQEKELAELLIQNDADVNTKNDQGNTPLHSVFHSAYRGPRKNKKKLVKLLVKNGADVHAVNNKGETPLDLENSSDAKDSEVVKFLETEMVKP